MTNTLENLKIDGIKENSIYNCDCLEAMKYIKTGSIDLVLTDPPYNENYRYRGSEYKDNREDYLCFLERVLIEIKRILKDTGSFYLKHSSRQIHSILPILTKYFIFKNLIVWPSNSQAHPNKNYDSYYEPIYFMVKTEDYVFNKRAEFRDKPPNYWSGEGKEFIGLLTNCWYDIKKIQAGCLSSPDSEKITNSGNIKQHPCSMPIKLGKRAINISSNPNDLILDPFLGSGTTAVACVETGRRFLGVEISQEYVDIANKRVSIAQNQGKLF